MKTQINILLIAILSFMLIGTPPISAQIVDDQGQFVDTTFHDNVDRTAEDFVIASLLISDPMEGFLSPAGHTALRVQCPMFGLDYVYHYAIINEDSISETRAIMTGKFWVQMVADSFDTYIRYNEKQRRGLTEYPLHLTPQEDQRLWQILDETLVQTQPLKYDFLEKGCCARSIIIIIRVLGDKRIDYTACDPRYLQQPYELLAEGMTHVPWLRFFLLTAMYGNFTHTGPGDNLFLPADLADAWQRATVNGRPLLGDGVRLLPNSYFSDDGWLTPMRVAVLVLILSLIALAIKNSYLDWVLLGIHVLMSLFVLVIAVLVSPIIYFNWLLIPFNLLPIICWRWRRYWALPYAVVLVVWCLVMLFVPDMFVDATHIILTLAWVFVLLKQSKILQLWHHSKVDQNIKSHRVINKTK